MFLAAKTTNYPVPLDVFTPKFKGLTQQDILDTEFLLAQSLGFEFWVRGSEKAFRGWGLEFQVSHSASHLVTGIMGTTLLICSSQPPVNRQT